MCICQVVCLHWSTCPLRTGHSRMTVAVTMSANSHRPRSFVFAMHEEETRSAIIQYATRLPKSTYMRVTSDHVFCNAIPKLSETHLADACCTASVLPLPNAPIGAPPPQPWLQSCRHSLGSAVAAQAQGMPVLKFGFQGVSSGKGLSGREGLLSSA